MKWKEYKNLLCKIALLILCCFVLFAAGCAARAQKMVPANFDVTNKHSNTVGIQTRVGGPGTNLRTDSLIPNSAFAEALTDSILKSGIFKGVVKGQGADYLLSVVILDYNQPRIGLDFDINVQAKWELSKSGQPNPVWSDTIATSYKSKFFKAFFAAERLQRANEGAVLANIEEGIKRLSALKL